MAHKRLFQELKQLNSKDIGESNEQIISLGPRDTEDIFKWEAVICKPGKEESKYYYRGQWKLNISVGERYPITPPNIRFDRTTPICHPNINIETGEICLNILNEESWSPAWNLEHTVTAILMLIDEPEPDSPLNIDLANLFRCDKGAFESVVQYYIWKFGTVSDAGKAESYQLSLRNSDDMEEDFRKSGSEEVQESRHPPLSADDTKEKTSNWATSDNDQEINIKVIEDVGQQVKRQFIDKVNELSSNVNTSSERKDEFLCNFEEVRERVTENVTNNVTREVEKICHGCNGTELDDVAEPVRSISRKTTDTESEKIKENFMKQVDSQIKMHEENTHKAVSNSHDTPARPTPKLIPLKKSTSPAKHNASKKSKSVPASRNY